MAPRTQPLWAAVSGYLTEDTSLNGNHVRHTRVRDDLVAAGLSPQPTIGVWLGTREPVWLVRLRWDTDLVPVLWAAYYASQAYVALFDGGLGWLVPTDNPLQFHRRVYLGRLGLTTDCPTGGTWLPELHRWLVAGPTEVHRDPA